MKTFIGVVCMATMLFTNPSQVHAMFGHVAAETERRQQAEQRLSQEQQRLDAQQRLTVEQQQRTSRWQTTAFLLGVATIVTLIVGTAIGSRGRQYAAKGE